MLLLPALKNPWLSRLTAAALLFAFVKYAFKVAPVKLRL
jgi:hypothetical protein